MSPHRNPSRNSSSHPSRECGWFQYAYKIQRLDVVRADTAPMSVHVRQLAVASGKEVALELCVVHHVRRDLSRSCLDKIRDVGSRSVDS